MFSELTIIWKMNVVLVLDVITVSVQRDYRWFLTEIFNFLILGSFSLVLGGVHNGNWRWRSSKYSHSAWLFWNVLSWCEVFKASMINPVIDHFLVFLVL